MPAPDYMIAGQLQNLFPTLSTAGSFTALELTSTEPKGTNIVEGPTAKVLILPQGTDAANESFLLRFSLWFRVPAGSDANAILWYPMWLGDTTCTLGLRKGAAGTQLGTTVFIGDAVVAVNGDSNILHLTAGNDQIGGIVVPCYGAAKLEVEVSKTTAESGGCLAVSIS